MALDPKAKFKIVAEDETARAWASAMKRADGAGKQIAGIVKTAFAGVSVAAIGSAINKAIEFGDEIGKLSVKTGVGVTAVSELAHAAKMADVDLSSLSTALKKMQINTSEAASGNKQMLETFAALGISVADFRSLKADEQFEAIAQKLSELRDPADRARAAVEMFGKAGSDLLPMFEQGAAGIRKAREQAQELGVALSEEQVRLLQQGDDAIKKLGSAWDGLLAKMALGTLHLSQALDLIDKDKLGELNDQLASAKRELMEATMPSDGGPFDPATYQRAADEVQRLERLIANTQDTYSRGGGPRRGRAASAPPGFKPKPKTEDQGPVNVSGFTDEMRKNIRLAESWQGIIDDTDRGISKGIEETSKSIEDSLGDISIDFQSMTDDISIYWEQGMRNLQSYLADFFIDPFHDGLDGMLKGFVDTLRQMAAQKAAAKVFEGIGNWGKENIGAGGFTGFLADLASTFDGGMAKGGPLQQGKWYIAGEHGPEPIWGGGAGAFAAGYGGGGGVTYSPVYNIDARGATMDFARALPGILKQHGDEVKADLLRGIRNKKYPI